jgi:cell division protein FtsX
MSLTVALAINVTIIVALLAGLAYVMSRTKRLTPHTSTQAEPVLTLTPSLEDEERIAA